MPRVWKSRHRPNALRSKTISIAGNKQAHEYYLSLILQGMLEKEAVKNTLAFMKGKW